MIVMIVSLAWLVENASGTANCKTSAALSSKAKLLLESESQTETNRKAKQWIIGKSGSKCQKSRSNIPLKILLWSNNDHSSFTNEFLKSSQWSTWKPKNNVDKPAQFSSSTNPCWRSKASLSCAEFRFSLQTAGKWSTKVLVTIAKDNLFTRLVPDVCDMRVTCVSRQKILWPPRRVCVIEGKLPPNL